MATNLGLETFVFISKIFIFYFKYYVRFKFYVFHNMITLFLSIKVPINKIKVVRKYRHSSLIAYIFWGTNYIFISTFKIKYIHCWTGDCVFVYENRTFLNQLALQEKSGTTTNLYFVNLSVIFKNIHILFFICLQRHFLSRGLFISVLKTEL